MGVSTKVESEYFDRVWDSYLGIVLKESCDVTSYVRCARGGVRADKLAVM